MRFYQCPTERPNGCTVVCYIFGATFIINMSLYCGMTGWWCQLCLFDVLMMFGCFNAGLQRCLLEAHGAAPTDFERKLLWSTNRPLAGFLVLVLLFPLCLRDRERNHGPDGNSSGGRGCCFEWDVMQHRNRKSATAGRCVLTLIYQRIKDQRCFIVSSLESKYSFSLHQWRCHRTG